MKWGATHLSEEYNQEHLAGHDVSPPFPRSIMLEASNFCNNHCIFCPHHNTHRKPTLLDLAFAERILVRAFALGARECAFHGGAEPFMHPKLYQLVAIAKAVGYEYVYLTTNALACTWGKLEQTLDAGLDSLKFSVNAGTPQDYISIHGHDGFLKVLEMARRVSKWRKDRGSRMKFYITAVTCPQNVENMPELHSAFHELVDAVEPYPAAWLGERTALPITDTVRRFPAGAVCSELFSRCTITASGFVRVCCSGSDDFMLIGDANTTDIMDIWHGEHFKKLRQAMLVHKLPENTVCFNCMNFKDTPLKPMVEWLAAKTDTILP